jgi:hypothetical protein
MTNDIDLNKLVADLPREDKIMISCLGEFDSQFKQIIDDIALEYKVDDSVAVASLKKSAAVIMATLIGWVINRGKDETKES